LRIVPDPAGGSRYLIRGAADSDWTLVLDTRSDANRNQDQTLRLGIHQASHDALIRDLTVRKAVRDDTGVSLGTEEAAGGCFSFSSLWQSAGSSEDVWTTTPLPQAPGSLVAEVTETGVQLDWSWNGDDDATFLVERCLEADCPSFVVIASTAAGSRSYEDTSAAGSQSWRYQVRAAKSSACGGWQSAASGQVLVRTLPEMVADLVAIPVNSRMIRLDWTPFGGDEDGYRLFKQGAGGQFVPLVDLPATAVTHTDTLALEPEHTYRYQLRAWRVEDPGPPEIRSWSGVSNTAEAITPAWTAGDGVCAQ